MFSNKFYRYRIMIYPVTYSYQTLTFEREFRYINFGICWWNSYEYSRTSGLKS
ncbi:hypothetical protein PRAC110570_13045 [Propionibacterium acidifaciens]